MLLSVYDSIEKLLVQTFFQIMENGNLNLLNPKNKKVSQKKLKAIWEKIKEEYYKKSNPTQYESNLSRAKQIELYNAEISGCSAGINIYELTQEIDPVFESFGYDVKTEQDVIKVRNKLRVRKTQLNRLISSAKKEDKKEAVSFWELVDDLEYALKRQLDMDKVTVSRWIEYINGVKKRHEWQNKKR